MRKFIIATLLLLGLVFVFAKLAEVQAIVETLQRGDWRFILLALIVQAGWLVIAAAQFQAVYRALCLEEKLAEMINMVAAANFINVIAPSVGMGGMAVFIAEAKKKGYPSGRVMVAGVLFVMADYVGFLCVLALGLVVLFRRNNLNLGELIASATLVLIACGLATLLYLGMRSASALGRVLAWMAHRINRILWPFIHRDYLSEQRAHDFAHDAAEGLREIRGNPRNLLVPATFALLSKTLLIVILLLMFLAFKVPFSIGTLIAGFSIGYLFLIVSPTPAGIGFVEGALTLSLRSLNVSLGAATVLALAYRGITFWIPLLVGMVAFRHLSQRGKDVDGMGHPVQM